MGVGVEHCSCREVALIFPFQHENLSLGFVGDQISKSLSSSGLLSAELKTSKYLGIETPESDWAPQLHTVCGCGFSVVDSICCKENIPCKG